MFSSTCTLLSASRSTSPFPSNPWKKKNNNLGEGQRECFLTGKGRKKSESKRTSRMAKREEHKGKGVQGTNYQGMI
jgi:hypothetical protein